MKELFDASAPAPKWGVELLQEAIDLYNPSHVFGLFSGGHDSLTACHHAAQHPAFSGCVHINTGTGLKETRDYVYATCERFGWPLKEYRALEDCGQSYEELVLKFGFPGPHGHGMMYQRLKERAVIMLTREHKQHAKDKIVLVSGCRSQESERRMGTTEPIQHRGARIWVAIIHPMSKCEVNEYIAEHGLPRNPVVDLIHKSGECLCGAFAKKHELAELELWFPERAAEIRALEARVRERGFPWGWEDAPPRWWLEQQRGQEFMFEMEDAVEPCEQHLCWACNRE